MKTFRGPGELFSRRQNTSNLYRVASFASLALIPLAFFLPHPPVWIVLNLIAARILFRIHKHHAGGAGRARSGARGEDLVALTLSKLPAGWQVERNILLYRRGDVDFLVTSPTGKVFLIDAKAHYGRVEFLNDRLYRRIKGQRVEFEKDFLSQVRMQVSQICSERSLPYVEALLVFTKAKLNFEDGEIFGVRVMQLDSLLAFLIGAGSPSPSPFRPVSHLKKRMNAISTQQQTHAQKTHSTVLQLVDPVQDEDRPTLNLALEVTESDRIAFDKLSEIERIEILAKATRCTSLGSKYLVRLHQCWCCHEMMLVFDWVGHSNYDIKTPPLPVPFTLQKQFSRSVNLEYWANICPRCEQLQGDHFVHDESSRFKWHKAVGSGRMQVVPKSYMADQLSQPVGLHPAVPFSDSIAL
jgi:hypothetical protein